MSEGNKEIIVKGNDIFLVAKALASEKRMAIIRLLSEGEMWLNQISRELGQSQARVSEQIKLLERAGLIKVRYERGIHGIRKICSLAAERIILELT